jgi:hypothetical protein
MFPFVILGDWLLGSLRKQLSARTFLEMSMTTLGGIENKTVIRSGTI